MERKNTDLGSGNVRGLLFRLALPTITSQIVNMLYNLVDRVYIGRIQPVETVGKLALTGVGVCLPVIMVISAFSALMAMGGAPRASIAEGRGEVRESERIMGNCMTMLVFTALVLTLAASTAGAILASTLTGRLLGISVPMSMALGMNVMVGFPMNMLISQEIIEGLTEDAAERQRLMNEIAAKMVLGGMVTTTFLATLAAGLLAPLMH